MPSQTTIRVVRRGLLLVLIGFAAVIGFLLWFGQQRTVDRVLARDRTTQPGELDVDVSTGFDYTISVRDQKLMRIRADRVVSRAGKEVHLEQLGPIELYRSDGNTVFVSADRGSFNLESGGASLIGNVEVRDAEEASFVTEHLVLAEEGRVVRSRGEVRLSKGEQILGSADRFAADLDEDVFRLVGQVRFVVRDQGGGPSYELSGRRATYYPDRSEMQLAGDVTLTHGEGKLNAREMTAIGREGGGLEQVRFRRGVNGEWIERRPAGPPARIGVLARDLDLDFDTSGALVESRLRRNPPAELTLTQGSKRQSLQGLSIHLTWNQGHPVSGSAQDRVQIVESTPAGGRSAVGDMAEFSFAGGDLSEILLNGNVRIQEEDGTTTGHRALYRAANRAFRVTGSPATSTFPTGTLTSPEIVYNADERRAVAVAPVRGEFERGREPGVISGEAPTRFEAREATWNQAQGIVTLSGEARIWQARDLLVAAEISSNLDRRSVTASGDVRVILEQRTESGPVRVEAASNTMTYTEAERVIHMVGESTAQREGRTLTCADLDVILNPEGDAERMICSGGTRLLDPVAGRTVTGESTVYEIDAQEARFTGDPVVVEGKDGSRVSGLRLRYRLDTGEAIMDLGDQPPTPETDPVVLEATTPPEPDGETDRGGESEPGTASASSISGEQP